MKPFPHRLIWLLLAASLGLASPVRADDEVGAKATARELFHRAGEQMRAGDYAAAADLYGRSNAIFAAPTAVLGQARALVKLGKLLTAAERYNDVIQADLGPKPSKAFVDAVGAAKKERALIMPRVPALVIRLDGDAEVRLDGEVLPAEALGVERLVNPGDHVVSAHREGESLVTRELDLGEGQVLEVPLSVPDAPTPAAPGEAPSEEDSSSGAAQRITGYALIGLGGAAVAAFAVSGGLYLAAKSTVDDECDEQNLCSSDGLDAVDRARTAGTVNTASLVIALVAGGAGLTLVLTAPDDEEQVALAPLVSPTSWGLSVAARF